MAPRSFLLDDTLAAYIGDHSPTPDLVTAGLLEDTAVLGEVAGMQIGVDQATLLTTLCTFARVESAVEIGTFTGRSALAIARGLAPGGRLVCCDVNEEWTTIARRVWRDAGVADRIDLRIAPAIETLRALPEDAALDLVFIDADKAGYVDYYEQVVPRLRPGGVVLADNTLWSGRIIEEPADGDAALAGLRRYNDRAANDPRVRTTILTVGDGVTISQRL